ncbi:MAG: response regulator transcription factor [Actinomycetota bacterium]|nr:response regulator transcription factor [Actinomycetota bacterium]
MLADDHALFRAGLRALLEEHGVDIAGEAADGAEAVEIVRQVAPQVVLMDLNMPAMTGVEATQAIGQVAPLTRVVVLTISDDDDDVIDAILAGACGYLLKDASIDDLVRAIHAAASGDSLISPQIAAKVLQRVRSTNVPSRARDAVTSELSERELDVLRLVACGKDNAEIARELSISPKTVKNHISSILVKLHIENRIQAAVYAVRSGIA